MGVIAAEDTTCTDPSSGSCVMRTTLSAPIPIVQGGINIFCDGIAAKTDLREVADVDIVVGTAKDSSELSNLEIKVDVTDSALNPETERTQIDSDSIEAGVMTLVIKGKDEYFLNNAGRNNVKVELEDVITIHIMSPAGTTERADQVEVLITQAQDDNTDTNGLDTDGYALNGAFNMVIDRSALRARLEPSTSLLNLCPFNPVRPTANVVLTETCVTRRDVRYRGYPFRAGAYSTALEICVASDTTCAEGDAQEFFTSFLGNSDYAKDLADGHTQAIFSTYALNGRYRRAYMINPGYEWTPTQTGGASIFSVSQKLFMFALITLDEGIATSPGNAEPTSSYPTIRRRMLLSSVDDALKDGQSGLGGASLTFKTTPETMLATAFDVPVDRVATYTVDMKLTQSEACMEEPQLADSLRGTLKNMVEGAASAHETVQILTMKVNKAGISCRRSLRGLKTEFSGATVEVTMAVVFSKGEASEFSISKLEANAGINSVTKLDVSPRIQDADENFVAPKENDESSGGTNVALIGGIAGGAGALVLLVGGLIFMKIRSDTAQTASIFMKIRSDTAQPVTVPTINADMCKVAAVPTINVEDLKSQLAREI